MKSAKLKEILVITITGCAAAVHGVLAIAAIVGACLVFKYIPDIDGYMAVAGFFAAIAAIGLAIGLIYTCGLWIVKKGSFLK